MARSMRGRAATLALCVPMVVIAASPVTQAAQRHANSAANVKVVASEFGSNFIPLGIGKSVVIDLPEDVKDVLVADPKIANAVVRTVRRAYLIGVSIGQTNIYFFDAQGRQIAGFDIAVTRDLNGMRGTLQADVPRRECPRRGDRRWGGAQRHRRLSARRPSTRSISPARLVGDNAKVVNNIIVRGRDQVMLKVTVGRSPARRYQAARHQISMVRSAAAPRC